MSHSTMGTHTEQKADKSCKEACLQLLSSAWVTQQKTEVGLYLRQDLL